MANGSQQLDEVKAQFEAASSQAKQLLTGNSSDILTRRPQPERWSAAECIAHLTLTNQHYPLLIRGALEQAPPGDGPYGMDFRGRLLRWILEPPYRSGVKTMPSMEPQRGASPEQVLAAFLASQDELLRLLEAARGKALEKTTITSPFSKRMRYNAYSCFHVLAAHERRHLWQAEQALAQRKTP
ncbi:MAG TPA: DinB family protein [Terriglobales bacterium]|nr:DinB family protein [Terriglobales bacterium]